MKNLTNAEPDSPTFYASERRTYKCKPGFIRRNSTNDHESCVYNNGTLSVEGILEDCAPNFCPAPNFTFEHMKCSVLANSSETFWDGSVVQYICEKGYTNNDAEPIKATCNASSTDRGTWRLSRTNSNCTRMLWIG